MGRLSAIARGAGAHAALVAAVFTVSTAASVAAGEHAIATLEPPDAWGPRWDAGVYSAGADAEGRWVRFETRGRGGAALVANREPLDPPADFAGRFVRVRVEVEDVAALAGMGFRLYSDEGAGDYFEFSLPLFDDPEFGLLKSGEWLTTTFSFGSARAVGRPDRSAIDTVGWVLRDHPGRPLVAYWGGLDAVDEPARGVVTFAFDDGYDEHFTVAAPLMAARGFRGTAYVMPKQIGGLGYMNALQLRELYSRYGWDVSAHHAQPFTEFDAAALDREMAGIVRDLRRLGFADTAGHLAYPLGRHEGGTVVPLARKHFRTARIAGAGPETLPPADFHRLRVVNVIDTTTPEQIRDAVRRAREHREWLILMFHWLVDEPEIETQYAIADFRRALELIAAEKPDVRTVHEVWTELAGSVADRRALRARLDAITPERASGGSAAPAP